MIIYLYNLYTNWPLHYPNGDSISVPFLAKSNSQTSENSLFRQIFLLSNIYLYFFWHKNLACKKLKRFLSIFFLLLFTLWTNVRLVSRYERYCHFCRKLYGGVKSGLWLWETQALIDGANPNTIGRQPNQVAPIRSGNNRTMRPHSDTSSTEPCDPITTGQPPHQLTLSRDAINRTMWPHGDRPLTEPSDPNTRRQQANHLTPLQ